MRSQKQVWGCRWVGLLAVAIVGVVALLAGAIGSARAAFPGGNGLIAFTRVTVQGASVSIIRPDRGGLRTLIADASAPAWSPDGRFIAFDRVSPRGDWDLFVANADGSNEREIDHPGSDDLYPSWSPDGSQLAYTDGRDAYVVNVDGSDRHALTDDHFHGLGAVWSPRGNWIACEAAGGEEVTIIHPDGSGQHVLYIDGAGANPSWSPNGTKIAYASAGNNSGVDDDIYVSDAYGHDVRDITPWPGYKTLPSWSPDGTQIVYDLVRTPSGGQAHADLYVMNADGTHSRPLVRGPASKWGANWQALR